MLNNCESPRVACFTVDDLVGRFEAALPVDVVDIVADSPFAAARRFSAVARSQSTRGEILCDIGIPLSIRNQELDVGAVSFQLDPVNGGRGSVALDGITT